MHISLCICGQTALSVLDGELVSIWLFVYPSVTCNILDTSHYSLIKRDRMIHVSMLMWQFHNCIDCWHGGYYFVPWLRAVSQKREKRQGPTLSKLEELMLLTTDMFTLIEQIRGKGRLRTRLPAKNIQKNICALHKSSQGHPGLTWHTSCNLALNRIHHDLVSILPFVPHQ